MISTNEILNCVYVYSEIFGDGDDAVVRWLFLAKRLYADTPCCIHLYLVFSVDIACCIFVSYCHLKMWWQKNHGSLFIDILTSSPSACSHSDSCLLELRSPRPGKD